MIGYSYSMLMGTSFSNVPTGPVNIDPPTIDGGSSLGSKLRVNRGTWIDAIRYAFQWNRNGNPIEGSRDESYLVTIADSGASISCTVTAIGDTGSTSITSNIIIIDIIE